MTYRFLLQGALGPHSGLLFGHPGLQEPEATSETALQGIPGTVHARGLTVWWLDLETVGSPFVGGGEPLGTHSGHTPHLYS